MKWLWLTVILALSSMRAQDLRRAISPADRGQLIAQGWPAAKQKVEAALLASYFPGGTSRPGSTGVSGYSSWLLFWKWADLLTLPVPVTPGEQSTKRILADEIPAALLGKWVNDDAFSQMLFANLSEGDDRVAALCILRDLAVAQSANFNKYRALAVALAIVYDQPFPADWPHHQVAPRLVPKNDISVAARFAEWIRSNESNELFYDLRTLSPEELKFLVDAPLDPIEFEWARKKIRFSRGEFAKVFSSVNYDLSRLKSQQYSWDTGPYTLEEIMRHGGICVDQAYYAMVAGKAHGLPTLFFVGQGTDGGHAWFGYLKQEGRWEMDCGRYENQGYSVGVARDPQTWQTISDHELDFLTKSFRATSLFLASQNDLLMAQLFEKQGNLARALVACSSAIDVCPANPDPWKAKNVLLEKTNAPLQMRRQLLEKAAEQFSAQRDLRVDFQMGLAKVLRAQGEVAKADELEDQIVSQNRNRRADLSTSMASTKLQGLIESHEFDAAFSEYRDQLGRLGKTGGGNFFYEVVEPFALSLKGAGNAAKAREVVSLARKALKPENDSILDVDLKALSNQIEAKTTN